MAVQNGVDSLPRCPEEPRLGPYGRAASSTSISWVLNPSRLNHVTRKLMGFGRRGTEVAIWEVEGQKMMPRSTARRFQHPPLTYLFCWSHPPGLNRRPTDYETSRESQILDNTRMGPPFTTPPDGITAVVEQVSEQVAPRTQWSQRAASDNRCTQTRFLRSPQPLFPTSIRTRATQFPPCSWAVAKTGSMLETIAGDLSVSRWRLRQTVTNELVGRRRATAQPGLACSSSCALVKQAIGAAEASRYKFAKTGPLLTTADRKRGYARRGASLARPFNTL
jgi:hypothetical protein